MRVDRLELRDFTVFEPGFFDFSPGLNVLIGANGTGKSHVLKLLFSILRPLESPATETVPRSLAKERVSESVWSKLIGVFRPDPAARPGSAFKPDAPGGLYKSLASHGTNHFGILARGDFGGVQLDWQHDFNRAYRPPVEFGNFTTAKGHAVFIPAHEVLSIYPGFIAASERRELSFDETVRDLCVDLSANPLRSISPPVLENVVAELDSRVGGKTVLRGDRFYVMLSEDWLLEAAMLAEGLRKLAAVTQLIRNGSIAEGSVLFWDEPETNLNPKLMPLVATALMKLAAAHVQVFVATHDYLLTNELSVAAEYGTPEAKAAQPRFFCLGRSTPNGPVDVQSGNTVADLPANPILEEFAAHYDRNQQLFAQTGPPAE